MIKCSWKGNRKDHAAPRGIKLDFGYHKMESS